MPTWLAVIIAGCALTVTVTQLLVRAGFWAGKVDQRSSAPASTDHALIMAKLESIHEDTRRIRQQGHENANLLTTMKGLEQDIRDELRGRRGRG